MVPVYLIVGLINIFSQHHNYGIKIDDPDFDIRVRRSVENTEKLPVLEIPNYIEKNVLKREKREPYYKKTIITDNDILKNNESQIQRNVGNLYDIYNPNYSFINFTRNNQNNTGITNNKPVLRPNPYRYPKTGYNVATTTSGYRNQNDNTPEYYNYQNPSGRNFGGFAGYTDSTPGYSGVTSGYYSAARDSRPNNYLLNNAQTTGNSNNGLYNNLVVNNKENLPQYAVNYNNAYSVPNNRYVVSSNGNAPSGYAKSSNGYVAPSNGYVAPSNGYVAPSNGYVAPSNGYVAPSNGYVAPSNGYAASSNGNTAPSNGYVAPSNGNAGSSNGYVAPSNGYVAPSNGYAASSNAYAASNNGNAVPSNAYAASNNGYAVPNSGNTAFNNAYPPSNTYATPSQNDYVFPSINDYNTTPSKVFPSATTNATPSNIFPSATTNANPSNVIPSTTVTSSSTSTGTTTEKIRIKSGCVICNIPCPKFMRRFGRFCIDENYNDY